MAAESAPRWRGRPCGMRNFSRVRRAAADTVKSGPRVYRAGMRFETPEDAIWAEIGFYDSELERDPGDSSAMLSKGLALNELRRYDEGFELLDRAMALDRKYLKEAVEDARAGEGSAGRGRKVAIARMKRRHMRAAAESAHLSKAAAMQYMRKYPEALSHIKRALKLNPRNGEAYCMIGCVLDDMERPSKSIKWFDRALRLGYVHPAAYYRKAHALNNCMRPREAVKCLREVLGAYQGYADAHYEMATSYSLVKDQRRAIECYKRAIEADPNHKKAHEYLGIAYMAVYQDELARPYLERALELAPGDPDVLEVIGLLED